MFPHGKLQMPFKARRTTSNFMRRLFSYISIILLTLLVSGWGSVLAATLCPHAGANQPQATLESHSACHTKTEQAAEHHSGSRAGSEAMHHAKTMPKPELRFHGSSNNAAALTLPAGTCTHCVEQNKLPATPTSALGSALQKHDAGKIIIQTAAPVSLPAVFSVQFAPTQHAPPGRTNRKHILLSVFLI